MAITYSYTNGDATNLGRLRYLLGDHRGVPGVYADIATFVANAKAAHTDEELNDLLAAAMTNGDILSAARIAIQCRINREAHSAGVAGTTDTSDRPNGLTVAANALERLAYPKGDQLPGSEVRTNADIDNAGLTDMGDDA